MGTTNKLENVIVLGMLTQIKHGKYSLEDPTGCVDLDMTEAKFHRGLYTENCFVLVEGNRILTLKAGRILTLLNWEFF